MSLSVLLVLMCLFGCKKEEYQKGSFDGLLYQNAFFGFSMQYLDDYYVYTEEQMASTLGVTIEQLQAQSVNETMYEYMIGATSEIIKFAKSHNGKIIIGTEIGVVDYLSTHEENGERFIQLSREKLVCEDMKITTLEDVYKAVIGEQGESIELDEALRKKALKSIDKMLELG